MFYITENDFINNDVIKYKDENNNTLRVTAPKDGNSLSVKLRCVYDVSIDVIRLELPLNKAQTGINYSLKYLNEKVKADHEKDVMKILKEVNSIIENWVDICMDLSALTSNNMSLIANAAARQGGGMTYENKLMAMTEFVLQELYTYDEMKPFVDLYVKLVNSNDVKID
jgi:hypothetical protein